MNKPELLAPAGSFEKAKIAFLYGADAVYAGTSSLSLRTRADMQDDDLEKTIKYAHSIGKKVYVTLNIFAWDDKYDEIIEMAKKLEELKPDGIIAADGGVMEILKQYAPSVKINVSTQANIVSLHAIRIVEHLVNPVIKQNAYNCCRKTCHDNLKPHLHNLPVNNGFAPLSLCKTEWPYPAPK